MISRVSGWGTKNVQDNGKYQSQNQFHSQSEGHNKDPVLYECRYQSWDQDEVQWQVKNEGPGYGKYQMLCHDEEQINVM